MCELSEERDFSIYLAFDIEKLSNATDSNPKCWITIMIVYYFVDIASSFSLQDLQPLPLLLLEAYPPQFLLWPCPPLFLLFLFSPHESFLPAPPQLRLVQHPEQQRTPVPFRRQIKLDWATHIEKHRPLVGRLPLPGPFTV